ncbi:MAG: M50 family metallopeptidase [Planctomycetaceae bacterium]|nr:M50 family metallopeptidase [Planctomycetaceae bacterium]
MILAEPQRTAYDINFQLLGFPVRIHPLFWLVGFLLGYGGGGQPDGFAILTWVLVVFVSILIHELGHALMFRRFGEEAHIVLYWMGGLAVPGDDAPHSPWSSYSSSKFGRRARTPAEHILISFAGPAAGFIFAALIIAGVFASGGSVQPTISQSYIPGWDVELGGVMEGNFNLLLLVDLLLQVNIWWGVMNLLPIFPLDGGQIAQQLMIASDPWGGIVRSLWLSIIVAAAVAVIGGALFREWFIAIMFASLAVSNYLTLQQVSGGGRPW